MVAWWCPSTAAPPAHMNVTHKGGWGGGCGGCLWHILLVADDKMPAEPTAFQCLCFESWRTTTVPHQGCLGAPWTFGHRRFPHLTALLPWSHAAPLPVTPLAGSGAIACQSGLILYSKLMAPDKRFTSGPRDQREGARMSRTTRPLQPYGTSSIPSHRFVQTNLPKRCMLNGLYALAPRMARSFYWILPILTLPPLPSILDPLFPPSVI